LEPETLETKDQVPEAETVATDNAQQLEKEQSEHLSDVPEASPKDQSPRPNPS